MKNIYQISLEKFRIDGLKDMFDSLERAFILFNIDFYLIGAFARDLWSHIYELKEVRATRDIDLAILIANESQFLDLKTYLIESENFSAVVNEFTLMYDNRIQVDLLPFGKITNEDHTATFSNIGITTISTLGFEEVYQATIKMETEEEKTFKVSTLPGIMILKFLAWEDRPELRTKDIQDIAYIIKHYFDVSDDDIYENHNDLFEHDYSVTDIGSRVLGREMGQIVHKSNPLRERIVNLLNQNTKDVSSSPLSDILAKTQSKRVKEAFNTLKNLLYGIEDIVNK
jgi:predicted nucleotidyltransferase